MHLGKNIYSGLLTAQTLNNCKLLFYHYFEIQRYWVIILQIIFINIDNDIDQKSVSFNYIFLLFPYLQIKININLLHWKQDKHFYDRYQITNKRKIGKALLVYKIQNADRYDFWVNHEILMKSNY